jgi:thiol-disulfide isomerase/thioredoxin
VHRRTLLAAAPVAFLVAGCTNRPELSAADTQQGADPRSGTVVTFLPGKRPPAPPVTGELLDGTPFDIATWKGDVVVVNFWGSWCAPCRAEAPDLQATYLATKDLGVRFLGIDVRDERDAAKAFADGHAITYPSLFDPPGRVSLGFTDVPPNVVPATILLDRHLLIAAVYRKRVYQRELEAAVRALAAEDTP